MYIIEAKSGVHYGNCVLGQGATEAEAWLDALGPKPWSDYTKKVKKTYWCKQVEEGSIDQEYFDDQP